MSEHLNSIPTISVVTPSFNQGEYIEETIQSVLGQNYPNLEYVIIDGGSTDNSVDIINKYDKRLHYWVSEKDNGHGHAINKGFMKTKGEIMCWINSDDMYTPWSFKAVAEIFRCYPNVMWMVGYNCLWNSEGAMTRASRVPKNIYDFLLGRYMWIQQESVFWRRALWEKAGGYINQDYKFIVDGELWTRFFLFESLYSVDCILSGYRVHSKNRAKMNYYECTNEMESAIAFMQKNCCKNILITYNKLKLIQRLGKYRPLNILLPRINLQRYYHSLYSDAQYKNIAWKDEEWRIRYLPFNL